MEKVGRVIEDRKMAVSGGSQVAIKAVRSLLWGGYQGYKVSI